MFAARDVEFEAAFQIAQRKSCIRKGHPGEVAFSLLSEKVLQLERSVLNGQPDISVGPSQTTHRFRLVNPCF